MLQRNALRCLHHARGGLLRSVTAFTVVVLLVSSCTVSRELDDLTAGCPDGTKFCGHECVSIDDPSFGCLADSCEPCQEVENATRMSCSNGECVVTKCESEVSKLCAGECRRLDSPEFGCNRPGCEPCALFKTAGYACNAFGSCEITNCDGGWDDCDDSSSNGCETHLLEDPHHCGYCAIDCDDMGPLPNADVACGAGACVIRVCDSGYKDCNGIVRDGCERNALTDSNNCGACGKKCSAGQVCTNGTCEP
jgi:hypothetical protein